MTAPHAVTFDVSGLQIESARVRGIGSYTRHLLAALRDRDDVQLRTWGFDREVDGQRATRPDVRWAIRAPADQRIAYPQLALRSLVAQPQGLMHLTSIFSSGIDVGLKRGSYVATVYDLIPAMWPDCYLGGRVGRWIYARYLTQLRSARRLLAISQSVADDVAERLGFPRQDIDVTPLGLIPLPAPPPARLPGPPYVFLAGTPDPHKNASFAIRAVAELPPATRPPVVMTGANADAVTDLVLLARNLGVKLEHRGRVPLSELARLYRDAAVVLLPSLYEGFGLQALEAMSVGARVVVSDRGALPEVAGTGAVVEPLELTTWAARIAEACTGLWPITAESAIRRAQVFSWERTAKTVIAAYESAVGMGRYD